MPAKPLVVRLRNWVGDVVLSLPTLQRLHDAGYALQLIGKGWATDLLAGFGWPVQTLPVRRLERIAQLRALRQAAPPRPPGGLDALCLPFSLSSALEMRLAGLRALGYAHEGRRLLLARSLPRPRHVQHELVTYWQLADALLGTRAPPPAALSWRLAGAHVDAARALQAAHGLAPGYVVVCPFSGGTYDKHDKAWPHFPAFAAQAGAALERRLVIVPGPGDIDAARRHYPGAICLERVPLGSYAALLADAALMVANDTGPGHLAAAVGTPLLSVLGPTEPERWGAWGPGVHVERGWPQWPTPERVLARAVALVQGATP